MAKGGKLRSLLKNQQLIESIDKSKSKPVVKKAEEIKEVEVQPLPEQIKSSKPKKEKKEKKAKNQDDYQSEVLSKKEQRRLKKVQADESAPLVVEEEVEEELEEGSDSEELDLEKLAASESESDINDDDSDEESDEEEEEADEDEKDDEEEEEEEDIPLSDVDIDDDADIVPHTKLTINNMAALKDSLARIELPWSKHSFQEHQSITSAEKTETEIKDIYDDTERELAFYKQGLDAVKQGRAALTKLKVPFSRPMDYFAEMIKSDEHMDKLKSKLLTEAANKKASEDAKKQRHLKKFGKQVQNSTLQERAKQKKETLDKIKSLKRKGASNELSNGDDFQIALDEATSEDRGGDNKRRKPNSKRLGKDSKYGFGGKKRGSRTNDAESSADISGFSSKKMKGKPRPGKSKRSKR
jgi:rRNA-processing protein EBP2